MSQPPVAEALAFLSAEILSTGPDYFSTPSSSTDTDSDSGSSLEMDGEHTTDSSPEGGSGSSSSPSEQGAAGPGEDFRFDPEDHLLAWMASLPDIDDCLCPGDSSPSSSDIPTSPCSSPPPVFAAEDDRLRTEPSEEKLLHYIPPPKTRARVIRGPERRTLDTEDLRINVVNNLQWQRFYSSETHASPPLYERDLPPCRPLGTPAGNVDERTKLVPPASVYKYTLLHSHSHDATALPIRCPDEDGNGYCASELFGPDADMMARVPNRAVAAPRRGEDCSDLITVEHTLRHKTDEATTELESATVTVCADPCAVEFWRASADEVAEWVRARKAAEERERLEEELRAFFENAADDEDEDEDGDGDDMEAVEIPESVSEADVSFDAGYNESSSGEDGGDVFDYDRWVADCLAL
ncbi:hypothetical protein LXA43DRAFT_1060874 [Ganoderma leucocontextum]|nr:hypothetical protein LXA43DRAFT_1060874 [Ganoderma leucocontextum]